MEEKLFYEGEAALHFSEDYPYQGLYRKSLLLSLFVSPMMAPDFQHGLVGPSLAEAAPNRVLKRQESAEIRYS
jgi:hypothetical protein